jgi:HAE1 family hydrophobic/amphiphilic exporter-1
LATWPQPTDGTEEQRTLALYNGKDAVGIEIKKTNGYSTTAVALPSRRKVEQLRPTLPKGAQFDVVRNKGQRVENSVENVQSALIEGRAAHGARRVPVPELVALDGHHRPRAAGVGAGQLHRRVGVRLHAEHDVAAGLSLAIGILIDDAIVVRENIVRHVEMGKITTPRARRHRRNRPRRRRHDVLHHRGVHPDRVPRG